MRGLVGILHLAEAAAERDFVVGPPAKRHRGRPAQVRQGEHVKMPHALPHIRRRQHARCGGRTRGKRLVKGGKGAWFHMGNGTKHAGEYAAFSVYALVANQTFCCSLSLTMNRGLISTIRKGPNWR